MHRLRGLRHRLPGLPVEVETETPMENDGPLAAMLLVAICLRLIALAFTKLGGL